MEIGILGALEVRHDGRAVSLGAGRQRALLALLVLERNRTVSGDRIIEELWTAGAPATAAKVVQNLVSQLRRRLDADGMLETRGHGYQLTLPDDSVDAVRFERLLDDGRRTLEDGDAATAAQLLREALALWRGPALAEFADELWARTERARLEERRLVAFERLIDAELELGRHADVVGELEAIVAAEPLREGLRAQLMLALYRSGRQAQALEAFQDARRTLVSELGIDPGPALTRLQEQILRQDPALDPPARPQRRVAAGRARPPAGPHRRRRTMALLIGGGLVVVLAAAAAVLRSGDDGDDGGGAARAAGGQVISLDPASGRIERRIAVGRTPTDVTLDGRRVWMVDAESRTLLRVDSASGDVTSSSTGATPMAVEVGAGGVWVGNGAPRSGIFALGPVVSEVIRVDPSTQQQRATVHLPVSETEADSGDDNLLAISAHAVWAVTASGSVVRIEPSTAVITATARGVTAVAVAAGGAGVWALTGDGVVVMLDERTARVRRRVRLATREVGVIAVGDSAAWVSSWVDGKLYRIAPEPDAVPGTVDLGATGVTDIAPTRDAVWTANPTTGTVTKVDPHTMRVLRTVQLGGAPRSVATDGRSVWVAVSGTGGAARSHVAGVRPVPSGSCGPIVAGKDGKADLLIVSDLPLQGDSRLAATQIAQAITFYLREDDFRAGRFRLAYQSCDDALAGTGFFDMPKCASNARAYAAAKDVVGVVGTFNSACASAMLPELNRAKGGPLAMVSPLNSYVGLTRTAEDPSELGRLYPTGRRSFVRVYPTDDAQGAGLAEFAYGRGRRRAYVLTDGDVSYSGYLADAFERRGKRLGLGIVGRARWRLRSRSYVGLARRIRSKRPDTVFVSGFLPNGGDRVVRDLRKVFGSGVDLMVPDAMAPPVTLLNAVGAAARGVFVANSGVVTTQLPPAGARFAQRFARTQPGADVEVYAIYAAQATQVMLDAIARSDGTRESVLDQVFRTHLRDGLIGEVGFDARGDIRESAVTVLRVVGGGTESTIASIDGAVVEEVVRVTPEEIEGG
jgi:DNA-binding SARP family transcriptional activator/ABC-type branched-subunit amino acid transport system substrate-binding protein